MLHRVAILSVFLIMCFLLLSYFDSQFFLIHLCESLIYVVVFVLALRREERWAYTLGIVAPLGWLLLAFVTSGFGAPIREVARLLQGEEPNYTLAVIGGIIAVLSLTMTALSTYRWKREFSGLKPGRTLFLGNLGIVAAYYLLMMARALEDLMPEMLWMRNKVIELRTQQTMS